MKGAISLSEELSIPIEEAAKLIESVSEFCGLQQKLSGTYFFLLSNLKLIVGKSVLDLINKDRKFTEIATKSPIDQLLGGGIMIGKVTEFCGVPGVGKTQLG